MMECGMKIQSDVCVVRVVRVVRVVCVVCLECGGMWGQ